ncbi:putative lipoprotein with Yx(FWY)xxD motif [Dyadobacter jejuensis]|uniref:Putative lipoprotein with Yx(FWY)xxD motif n=1 Tax=Dyadobacter jejuensis TaxID=1082580 RepID=A0A316AJH2_9BACT|nr:hypothetical protein [Dyadobacter jejuensis]PWJ57020.1 putative lipoprotein with Yx(FWY)xxD motif [Dyadobacter jejuensis]
MKKLTHYTLLSVMGLLALSCNDDDNNTPETVTYDIEVKETTLGDVLTDDQGMTLYFFTKDVDGNSTCTGNCLTNWPLFTKTTPTLDPSLDASAFGTITHPSGSTQVTYRGWPLYYYAGDAAAGDVKGENVGKVWFVAKTDYSIMLADKQLVGNDGKNYLSDYTEGDGSTQFLVDGQGRTLYGFVNDTKDKNNYTKEDFSNDGNWPIFSADLESLPSTVDKTLFGEIDVFGKKQLTFKGWPLYYFGADSTTRGATKGVSVPRPGVWPILNLDTPEASE